MTSKYTITISEDRIVISPQIKGVEIEANLNEGLWIARDGYNAKSVESLDEAIREVEEAIGYYADGDYEIVVDNVAAKLDSVMTSAEVCEAFALSESAVRKAIERDTIPARKSAGTWLIRRADAEARWGLRKYFATLDEKEKKDGTREQQMWARYLANCTDKEYDKATKMRDEQGDSIIYSLYEKKFNR